MLNPNQPKSNTSFSTLNSEKVSKLNSLILDSISTFNIKYKEINENLMELKLEFLNHLNAVQSLLHDHDDEENYNEKSQTPIGGNFFKGNLSPPFQKEYEKSEKKNEDKLKEKKDNKFERIIERKKTYTYVPGKNFKLSSILFNRERRDEVGKKNVSFHPESVKTPTKKLKGKKFPKKNENKINQDFENKDNQENINKDNQENFNKDNQENNNKEIELLSHNLRKDISKEEKPKKKILTELDLNSNNNNKDNDEDDSFISSNEDSSKIDKNSDNENGIKVEEINKTIFPSKTSQSGINFITKKKEEKIYSDTSDLGKELCNLLYIILGFEEKFDKEKNLRDLFNYLFENFKVNGIKDLFLKIIYNKVYIEENISEGLFVTFNQLISKHLKEIKLICQARNQPLCWIAMNILEFDRYFQMLFCKDK